MTAIRLRLICAGGPAELWNGKPTTFGLQDKKLGLLTGTARADGSIRFDFDAGVDDLGPVGPYVHGKPGERFLYLGWRPADGAANDWIRRWKIRLDGITPDLIAQLNAGEGLELRVAEAGKTVWFAGDEWTRFAIDRDENDSAVA